jgi:RNA polymerase sigma-70 factor (ECF subfamily)
VPASGLQEFLRQARPRLDWILYRYRIPPQDADDLVQETLLLLVAKWGSIRTPEAWLPATLRNRCILYWRRRRGDLFEQVDAAILEALAERGSPPTQRDEQLRIDLQRQLERLPERCRHLLTLRYGLGCTAAETADRLGYSPTSVPKLTRRCLARLTRLLVGGGFGDPRETGPTGGG